MKRTNDTAFDSRRSAFTPFRRTATENVTGLPSAPVIPIPVMNQKLQPDIPFVNRAQANSPTDALLPQTPVVLVARPGLTGADKSRIEAYRAALQEAIIAGDHDIVESLLRHEAADEIAMAVDQQGKNALWHAIECRNLPSVRRLLKLASANEQSMQCAANGDSPLLQAVKMGMTSVVQLLLGLSSAQEQLAQCNPSGACPSLAAASRGELEILKLMVLTYANTLSAKFRRGSNALHLAAQNGHLSVVDCLIKSPHGAALAEGKTHKGSNALHLAAQNGHLPVVEYLLKSKDGEALAKQQTRDGRTVPQLASSNGHREVVRALDESGLFETSSATTGEDRS